ncbi:MAG: hypothetical protein K2X68_09330 [Novosphingobium sp.]|nr:hypothetical protein [Novosphingobium sp.]
MARWISWIWHIRGEVPLPPGQSPDEAFAKLDPLFAHSGTTHARMGDMVLVTKRDQLAQDPLSVIDSGTLRIEPAEQGAVLRYHLVSRALLYCFLAPLLFLAVGQLTVFLGTLEKARSEEKASKEAAKKDKQGAIQLHPVDAFLGAPAPEKPKDGKKDAKDKTTDGDEEEDDFSPTAAYVFAGIFAALWLLGRLLEPWLIRRRFGRSLAS